MSGAVGEWYVAGQCLRVQGRHTRPRHLPAPPDQAPHQAAVAVSAQWVQLRPRQRARLAASQARHRHAAQRTQQPSLTGHWCHLQPGHQLADLLACREAKPGREAGQGRDAVSIRSGIPPGPETASRSICTSLPASRLPVVAWQRPLAHSLTFVPAPLPPLLLLHIHPEGPSQAAKAPAQRGSSQRSEAMLVELTPCCVAAVLAHAAQSTRGVMCSLLPCIPACPAALHQADARTNSAAPAGPFRAAGAGPRGAAAASQPSQLPSRAPQARRWVAAAAAHLHCT